MLSCIAIRCGEPSQHREPKVIELGLVRVPPTLQDAFKIRHAQPPCGPDPVLAGKPSTSSPPYGRGAEAPLVTSR